MTTIIERTPATRGTVVKAVLIYLAFTVAWVYGFANGRHDLPGLLVLAFFLLPLGVNFMAGFALAKQEACALLVSAPVLALLGPGLSTTLFVPREEAVPARRLAVLGAAGALGWKEVMQRRLGFVGEVYEQGAAGRFGRLSKGLTATGAALLAAKGRRSRAAAITGSALVLGGELALRWSVFKAGFQSARDPRYTVIPQRERLAAKKS